MAQRFRTLVLAEDPSSIPFPAPTECLTRVNKSTSRGLDALSPASINYKAFMCCISVHAGNTLVHLEKESKRKDYLGSSRRNSRSAGLG